MLSWSKISAARASAAPGPARCREIYQRYAAVLYRQALLNSDDTARPRPAVGDALVNERALAVMTGSIRGAQPPGTPEHRREHAGVMGTRRVRVRFRRPLRQPVYAGGAARWAFHAAIPGLGPAGQILAGEHLQRVVQGQGVRAGCGPVSAAAPDREHLVGA